MTILETERLRLRHFTVDDAPFLLELMNEPAWRRYIGEHDVTTLKRARRQIESRYVEAYERLGFGLYLVERKDDGLAVGLCGLVKREGLSDVDLGFGFLTAHHGRGYARESAEGVMEHARRHLGLRRLVAITDGANEPSIRLLERLGFVRESPLTLPGEDHPVLLFAHEPRS